MKSELKEAKRKYLMKKKQETYGENFVCVKQKGNKKKERQRKIKLMTKILIQNEVSKKVKKQRKKNFFFVI